jgi:hypothetical protein
MYMCLLEYGTVWFVVYVYVFGKKLLKNLRTEDVKLQVTFKVIHKPTSRCVKYKNFFDFIFKNLWILVSNFIIYHTFL